MKRLSWGKFFGIFTPALIIGFLILSVSLTFGTSDAGKALGSLEGILVIVGGTYILFSSYCNPVVKKYLVAPIKKLLASIKAKSKNAPK